MDTDLIPEPYPQQTVFSKVHGRVALIGEYLDGIFSNRAVTCGVANEWYELEFSISNQADREADGATDNRWLVPTLLQVVRTRVPSFPDCDVKITRDMRAGAGLGSSAAFSVGVLAAALIVAGTPPSRPDLAELAIEGERRFGITGGFMDQYSAVFGGTHAFTFHDTSTAEVVPLSMPDNAMLVIADSGVRRRSGEIIDSILARARAGEVDIEAFVHDGHGIADSMISALQTANPSLSDLGELVNQAHTGLKDGLRVSIPVLDRLIHVARDAGAYGAKISGAGFGGCIFALCDRGSAGRVAAALMREGADVVMSTAGGNGAEARTRT